MLDARENAAPVAAVNRLVNHALDFHVDAIATQDALVDTAEQIEQPALFARCRIGSGLITPGFGLVLRHIA